MPISKKREATFSDAPIVQAVLRLALPTVIGQIILVIYNMADTFFIGLTGSDSMITAVTICMPAFMFLSAISNLFGVGGSSVISQALGRQDYDRAGYASAFSFWFCLLVTACYSVGALLLRHPFLNALGGSDPDVHRFAESYLLVTVVLGGIPTALNTFFSHLVRSEGRSLHASIGIALGGVLNMGLDPLFMFVLLPKGQEALGAAIATALSNTIAMVYYIVILQHFRGRSVLSFRWSHKSLEDGIPGGILSAGLPACIMTLCENISYAVLDNLMSIHGTATQAGIGVAKKVNMLAHSLARGMSQGVLPLLGYNYASGNHKRMRSVLFFSMAISVGLSALCMVVNLTLSRQMIMLFIRHASDSVDFGARFLRILCIGGPFSAAAYSVISFFQAVGHGKRSFILAILRKGLLDIPLMFVLRVVFPVYGIVWATPIADIVCCITSVWMLRTFFARYIDAPQEGGRKAQAA